MSVQKQQCEICGEEVKNLGLHKYHKHKDSIALVENLVVNEHIPDKQLSDLISELRNILKRYSNTLTVKTVDQNGQVHEIEITARIQFRR